MFFRHTPSLERVAWGGLFLAIALAFSGSIEVQFTLPKLLALRTVAPLIVLLWVIRFRRGETKPVPRMIAGCVCALAGWWIVSTLFSVHPVTALQGMHGRYNGLLNQGILLTLFLVIATTRATRTDIEVLVTLLVCALVPVSLYAIAQSLGLDPLVWPNPRPGSTIGHPVPLAAMLAMAVPFALVFLLTGTSVRARVFWVAIVLMFLAASASTLSRGPWAGLVVAVGVVLIAAVRVRVITVGVRVKELKRSWIRDGDIGFALVVLVALLGLGLPSDTASRVTARVKALAHLETDPSFMNRFVYYDAALRMARDHPVVGVGLESYGLLYPRYRPVEGEAVPSDVLPSMVHNGYLQMAATNGLPGAALYVILIAAILLLLSTTYWRPSGSARDSASARDLLMGAAFIGAIGSYLVQDLSGWQEISLSVFFWVLLGLAVSFCTVSFPTGRWPSGVRWRTAGSLAAGAVATAIAALAVSTFREVRADRLFFEARFLDVSRDWPRMSANLAAGLQLVPDDSYYVDAAGVQYLKRMHVSGQRADYDQARGLFERAAAKNPFDPYILIHRLDTETTARQDHIVSGPSDAAPGLIATLLDMDPNNATAYESAGRLQFAEGQSQDALRSIREAEKLRPNRPRFHMIEGDALRSLGDKAGAIAAYRRETTILEDSRGPDWVVAKNKLTLALLETGDHDAALHEATDVIARAPSDVIAHTLLGFTYLEMNAPDMAKQSFVQALAIAPADPGARQGLAETERRLQAGPAGRTKD